MKSTFKNELLKAKQFGYAIPAFNFDNLDMLKGIILAAEEERSPIILMVTESAAKSMGVEIVMSFASKIPNITKVPTILHWDHGFDIELIKKACDSGFDSVMLDASKEPFEKNVALTKEVVQYAHQRNVEVESEIGHVGGKEDERDSKDNMYTNVNEAIRFDKFTAIDALAIAVGTSHGLFTQKPVVLRYDIIQDVVSKIKTPIVLHGASDVPLADIQKAIKFGITKINIGTDLKIAYANALRKWLNENLDGYDAKKFGKFGIEAVKKEAIIKIRALGSNNRV